MVPSASRPVLLVAHSPDAEQRVRAALASRRTPVIALRSVEDAMGALADERPLLTLLWPERISEALRPGWRALKVFSEEVGAAILATGAPSLASVEEALSSGVDEFLPETMLGQTLPQRVAVLSDAAVPRRHPPFRPRTVLVVDPDSMWRFRMGSILEGAGHRVLYASQPLEMMEVLQGLRGPTPDLCLMDPFGAGLDGLETVRAIRAQPSGRLPILMASAAPREPTLLEALRLLEVHDLLDKSHAAFDAIVPILQDYVSLAVRRMTPRISFLALCRYQQEAHELWDTGLVYNLSSGGAFIRTLSPLMQGAKLTLELDLGQGPVSRLKADVAWTQPFERTRSGLANPAPGMGVHFEQSQLHGELKRQLEARLWSRPPESPDAPAAQPTLSLL